MTDRVGLAKAMERISGRSIIAGRSVQTERGALAFRAQDPKTGRDVERSYQSATDSEVDEACEQAWDAFHEMCAGAVEERARLLERIASNITDLGSALIEVGSKETGLSATRLRAERDRTTSTLALFARTAAEGSWVRPSIDKGDSARRPFPKADIRSMLRPLGPVAVFGSCAFPLASSSAGGDVASALAAGCPVVVKGHPMHPGMGELAARAVADAVKDLGLHPGTYSFLHAGGSREHEVGSRLVVHPSIRAVGFTGSTRGGMALASLAHDGRDDPIPVFAQMGSTNPVFVLPGAIEKDAERVGQRLAGSLTNSGGQMCTCPGLIFVVRSDASERLARAMATSLREKMPAAMLGGRIADEYSARLKKVSGVTGVSVRGGSVPNGKAARDGGAHPAIGAPCLLTTKLRTFIHTPTLHAETFGPAAIIVECDRIDDLEDGASAVLGALTGSVWFARGEDAMVRRLVDILERRVGRIVFNGAPTGVEVCPSMVHGGPYPSALPSNATGVGPLAIERWARRVCYQDAPEGALPPELQDANPLKIRRLVDGRVEVDAI
ncbi:MAG: aldehyde dehydrogenase (NADP(+)) [Phycisphaerales bacterium]